MKMRMKAILGFLLVLVSVGAWAAPPAVLIVTRRGTDWGPVRRLQAETDFVVAAAGHQKLDWELLQQFNAVILFDMQRVDPHAPESTWAHVTPERHAELTDLFARYIEAGGGLYAYGVSFTHMGQGKAVEALNGFLQRFDAQAPFERLRDPSREARQPGGRQVLYALADRIVEHPVTAGVEDFWYPIGRFVYGPYVRPLVLGEAWTPLIFTSPDFASYPLENPQGGARIIEGATSAVADAERVPIFAVREFGKGRIVLNGGESTISFFGYDYSRYADEQWQRIGMERGLQGKPSQGWELFVNSLKWLVQPSLAEGTLGGYTPPPPEKREPKVPQPRTWTPADPDGRYHELTWQTGMIVVVDHRRVDEFVAAARARNFTYLVVAGRFEDMEQTDYERLRQRCAELSDDSFVAIPALRTLDHLDNHFIQPGPRAWPKPNRLDPERPERVRDHLGYWMNDSGFPMRIAYNFSAGQYPPWLHSGYNTFGIRTWRDGEIIDEAPDGYRQAQEQGDRSRLVSVHILSTPAALNAATELTRLRANSPQELADQVMTQNWSLNLGCVSNGPRLVHWHMHNAYRHTFTEDYVRGLQRWRANMVVEADVPLKQITVYDKTDVFRRFAVDGTRVVLNIDGLHDDRHVLSAVAEDVDGNLAFISALTTSDGRFRQGFCSDRCNIMGGSSLIRGEDGFVESVPASTMLYKAGRLSASTVGPGEELPGIDGSGQGVQFFLGASLLLYAQNDEAGEARSQVHRIFRPWESADGLCFRTPIARRSETVGHDIFGHRPYVDLHEPRVDAELAQYHFYRSPMLPSPALARFQLTARQDLTTKAGWHGFHVRYCGTWGKITRWAVVRADGTVETSPEADNRGWRGRLENGDSVYFPELGEGFFVRRGPLDIHLECQPSRGWFRLYGGLFEERRLAAGESVGVETILLRVRHDEEQGLADWRRFGQLFGLHGSPGYLHDVRRGTVVGTDYIFTAAAEDGGFEATFYGDLPQRLPVAVQGLAPNCTAGIVDRQRRTWQPLAVWQGTARTTIELLGNHPRDVFVGNLLATDNPDLRLTLLPANEDGTVLVAAHNPTAAEIAATIRVPTPTWLAPAQDKQITIPPMTTRTILLDPVSEDPALEEPAE